MGPITPTAANGSRFVLVCVDYMSRFILAKGCREADKAAVCAAMEEWAAIFG